MKHIYIPTTWVEAGKADQKHKVMLRGQSNFKAQLRLQKTPRLCLKSKPTQLTIGKIKN